MDNSQSNISLQVPSQAEVRNNIRKLAEGYVVNQKIAAPTTLSDLALCADSLQNEYNLPAIYQGITMVALGNAVWNNIFSSIPFHRRLLLLPQCLRDKEKCKGEFDDFGLICAGCKACSHSYWQDEAQKLGYITLIAEGTTTTLGLIKEGSIDAVLGVSCMNALQKSFETIYKSAIPTIGIPLLNDGCENTKFDEQWLKEVLYNKAESSIPQFISLFEIQQSLNELFTPNKIEQYFDKSSTIGTIAINTILQGGQRIRPALAILAYRAYYKSPDAKTEQILALIIECFHKASLVHDDIQDEDLERYNKPTVHSEYGTALAINVGDYLIGMGYKLIGDLPIAAEQKVKCLQLITNAHLQLTLGQSDDLTLLESIHQTSLNELLSIFGNKTGQAVKAALLLGALAGDAPNEKLKILEEFAILLGTTYQIKDDINEFKNKENSFDLRQYPLIAVLLFEDLNSNNHKVTPTELKSSKENFTKATEEYHILTKGENLLQEHIKQLYALLLKIDNTALRLGLHATIGKIFKQ